jgi:hypothetical protein
MGAVGSDHGWGLVSGQVAPVDPHLEVSFLFIPWVAMAATGMILLWALMALGTFVKSKVTRRSTGTSRPGGHLAAPAGPGQGRSDGRLR